jgi:tripartite-type tricarboxylate transporter receptor subunit TctC
LRRIAILGTLLAALSATPAAAQTFPARNIEMTNPYPAGGATDIMGRALAEAMAAHLGTNIVFLNRPGANGAIGTAAVARASADGHALLYAPAVAMIVNPLTQGQIGYTLKSFDHICQAFKNEMAIVTRLDSPIRSVADLVKAAQEKPGALSYGVLGIGSIPHLAMTEFSQVANLKMIAVAFRGDADVQQQVLGGHADFGAVVLASAARGDLRIIGLFSRQRNPLIPDVPTVAEQGYDVAPFSFGGVSVPAGTPEPAKAKLREACRVAARSENYLRVMKTVFQPPDFYADSAEYTAALERDAADKMRLLGQLGLIK